MVNFDSNFRGIVHSGGEGMVAGAGAAGGMVLTVRRQNHECWCSVHFLLCLQTVMPAHEIALPTWVIPSPLIQSR